MSADKKAYLSLKESISLPTLSNVDISEDGSKVAFVKTTTHWDGNTYRDHIWVYDNTQGDPRPLSFGEKDHTSPSWSPDSTHIAYLTSSNMEGSSGNQIFIRSMIDDTPIQVTNEKYGVSTFKWAPSGKGFYFIAQSEESQKLVERGELYGDFTHVDRDQNNNSLYYIDLENDNMISRELLLGENLNINAFHVSDDEKIMAFMATHNTHNDLYIYDMERKILNMVKRDRILSTSLCLSPDGSKICYGASLRERSYYDTHISDNRIEIYDIKSGTFTNPLEDFDSTVSPIRWTHKGILISWQDKTNYLVGILSEDGGIKVLNKEDDCFVMDTSITKTGDHAAYCKAPFNGTFDIYLDDKNLTNENSIFTEKLTSKKEIISWKSSDGLEIEGVLSTPFDLDREKRHPLLILVHGGPAWGSFPVYSGYFNERYPVDQFIEKGFIILEPNYRGSTGYGDDFLKANYRNLGIGDYEDLISGVDHLVADGIADADRVGVFGWSQGGFISSFCATYSDKFKAISVGGGITDWTTHYVNSDSPQSTVMLLGDTPWNDPDIYAKTSSMTYINSACTPTLIQHGEADGHVQSPNSYKLYRGLKDVGVPTELVIFKGMGYYLPSPKIAFAIMRQNMLWFSHYLLGDSLDDFRLYDY